MPHTPHFSTSRTNIFFFSSKITIRLISELKNIHTSLRFQISGPGLKGSEKVIWLWLLDLLSVTPGSMRIGGGMGEVYSNSQQKTLIFSRRLVLFNVHYFKALILYQNKYRGECQNIQLAALCNAPLSRGNFNFSARAEVEKHWNNESPEPWPCLQGSVHFKALLASLLHLLVGLIN